MKGMDISHLICSELSQESCNGGKVVQQNLLHPNNQHFDERSEVTNQSSY